MPRHIVCFTFDFDTQSGFIARGMTTPTPLSRGEFGATTAAPRILKFLKERGTLIRDQMNPPRPGSAGAKPPGAAP